MTTRRALGVALLLPLVLASACHDDGNGAGTTSGDTVAALGPVVVGHYQDLADSLQTLDRAVDDLCRQPSSNALEEARESWRDAAVAWRASRAAGIGPAMDRRLNAALGFLARPASVEALIAGDAPVDADSIEEAGAAVKGLSALELALFADGSDALAATTGARRCAYASGVATLAHRHATQVLDDWRGGYEDELVDGTPDQEALGMLVNELSHRLTELDDQGLRALAEASALDDLPANRLDGPAAFHLAELRAQLDGAAALIEGDGGLTELVEGRDPDLAERLRATTDDAQAAMAALPDSVASGFEDHDAIVDAQEAVARLKVLVTTEVASQLGITIGFSDADGDS